MAIPFTIDTISALIGLGATGLAAAAWTVQRLVAARRANRNRQVRVALRKDWRSALYGDIEMLEDRVRALEAFRANEMRVNPSAFRTPTFIEHWISVRTEIAEITAAASKQLDGYIELLERTDASRKEYAAAVNARLALQRELWLPDKAQCWMPFSPLPDVDWAGLKAKILK